MLVSLQSLFEHFLMANIGQLFEIYPLVPFLEDGKTCLVLKMLCSNPYLHNKVDSKARKSDCRTIGIRMSWSAFACMLRFFESKLCFFFKTRTTKSSCRWVPLLFGAAGIILGLSYPLLDSILDQVRFQKVWTFTYFKQYSMTCWEIRNNTASRAVPASIQEVSSLSHHLMLGLIWEGEMLIMCSQHLYLCFVQEFSILCRMDGRQAGRQYLPALLYL